MDAETPAAQNPQRQRQQGEPRMSKHDGDEGLKARPRVSWPDRGRENGPGSDAQATMPTLRLVPLNDETGASDAEEDGEEHSDGEVGDERVQGQRQTGAAISAITQESERKNGTLDSDSFSSIAGSNFHASSNSNSNSKTNSNSNLNLNVKQGLLKPEVLNLESNSKSLNLNLNAGNPILKKNPSLGNLDLSATSSVETNSGFPAQSLPISRQVNGEETKSLRKSGSSGSLRATPDGGWRSMSPGSTGSTENDWQSVGYSPAITAVKNPSPGTSMPELKMDNSIALPPVAPREGPSAPTASRSLRDSDATIASSAALSAGRRTGPMNGADLLFPPFRHRDSNTECSSTMSGSGGSTSAVHTSIIGNHSAAATNNGNNGLNQHNYSNGISNSTSPLGPSGSFVNSEVPSLSRNGHGHLGPGFAPQGNIHSSFLSTAFGGLSLSNNITSPALKATTPTVALDNNKLEENKSSSAIMTIMTSSRHEKSIITDSKNVVSPAQIFEGARETKERTDRDKQTSVDESGWFDRISRMCNDDPVRALDTIFDFLVDRHYYTVPGEGRTLPIMQKPRELDFIFFQLLKRLNASPKLQTLLLKRLCELAVWNESSLNLCCQEQLLERALATFFDNASVSSVAADWSLADLKPQVLKELLRFFVVLGTQTFSNTALSSVCVPLRRWSSLMPKARYNGIYAIELLRSVLLSSAQTRSPREYLDFRPDSTSSSSSSQASVMHINTQGLVAENVLLWPADGFTFAIWFREQGATTPISGIQTTSNSKSTDNSPLTPGFEDILRHELRGESTRAQNWRPSNSTNVGNNLPSDSASTQLNSNVVIFSLRSPQTGEGIELSLEDSSNTSSYDQNDLSILCKNIIVRTYSADAQGTGKLHDTVKVKDVILPTSCSQNISGWHWLSITLKPAGYMWTRPQLSIYVDAQKLYSGQLLVPQFTPTTRFALAVGVSALSTRTEFSNNSHSAFRGQVARVMMLKKPLPEDVIWNLCDLHTRSDSSALLPVAALESSEPTSRPDPLSGGSAPLHGPVPLPGSSSPWSTASFLSTGVSAEDTSQKKATIYMPATATSVPPEMYTNHDSSLHRTWDSLRSDIREYFVEHAQASRWERLPAKLHNTTIFSWDAKHVRRSSSTKNMVYCMDAGPHGLQGIFFQDKIRVVHRRLFSDVFASVGGILRLFPLLLECVHLPGHSTSSCSVDAALATRIIALLADLVSFELCQGISTRRAGHLWFIQGERVLDLLHTVLLSCCADALLPDTIMALASLVDAASLMYCHGTDVILPRPASNHSKSLPLGVRQQPAFVQTDHYDTSSPIKCQKPSTQEGLHSIAGYGAHLVPADQCLLTASVRLLFDFAIWSSASFAVQAVLFQVLHHHLSTRYDLIRRAVGVRPLLDALRFYYYLPEESGHPYTVDRRPCKLELSRDDILACRQALLGLIDAMLCGGQQYGPDRLAPMYISPLGDSNSGRTSSPVNPIAVPILEPIPKPWIGCSWESVSYKEIECLLEFCQAQKGNFGQLKDTLRFIISFISRTRDQRIPGVLDHIRAQGNLFSLWDLLASPNDEIQLLAIDLIHVYTIRTGRSKEPRGLMVDGSVDAVDSLFCFDVEHAALMRKYLTKSGAAISTRCTVDAILAFSLGVDFDSNGFCQASWLGDISMHCPSEVIIYPLAIRVFFGVLLADCTPAEVRLHGLKRIFYLLDLSDSRKALQNVTLVTRLKGWESWLLGLAHTRDASGYNFGPLWNSVRNSALETMSLCLFHRMTGLSSLGVASSNGPPASLAQQRQRSSGHIHVPSTPNTSSGHSVVGANSHDESFHSLWNALSYIDSETKHHGLDQTSLIRTHLLNKLLLRAIQLLRQADAGMPGSSDTASRSREQLKLLCRAGCEELLRSRGTLTGCHDDDEQPDLHRSASADVALSDLAIATTQVIAKLFSQPQGAQEIQLQRDGRSKLFALQEASYSRWSQSLQRVSPKFLDAGLLDPSAEQMVHVCKARLSPRSPPALGPNDLNSLAEKPPNAPGGEAWLIVDLVADQVKHSIEKILTFTGQGNSGRKVSSGSSAPSGSSSRIYALRETAATDLKLLCDVLVHFGILDPETSLQTPFRRRKNSSMSSPRDPGSLGAPSPYSQASSLTRTPMLIGSNNLSALGSPFMVASPSEGHSMPPLSLPGRGPTSSTSAPIALSTLPVHPPPPPPHSSQSGESESVCTGDSEQTPKRHRQMSLNNDAFVLVDEPDMPLVRGDIDRLTVLCLDLCRMLKVLSASEDHAKLVDVLCECVKRVCAELNASDAQFPDGLARLICCDWFPEGDDLEWEYSDSSERLFPISWIQSKETDRIRLAVQQQRQFYDCFTLLHREARVVVLKQRVKQLNDLRKQVAHRLDAASKQRGLNQYEEEVRKSTVLRSLQEKDSESRRHWKTILRTAAITPSPLTQCNVSSARRLDQFWKLDRRENRLRMRLRLRRSFGKSSPITGTVSPSASPSLSPFDSTKAKSSSEANIGEDAMYSLSKRIPLKQQPVSTQPIRENTPPLSGSPSPSSTPPTQPGTPSLSTSASVSAASSTSTTVLAATDLQNASRSGSQEKISANCAAEWDVVEFNSVHYAARNEHVMHSIECELILPICVVRGRMDLTARHLYFYGDIIAQQGGFADMDTNISSNALLSKRRRQSRWSIVSAPNESVDTDSGIAVSSSSSSFTYASGRWWLDEDDDENMNRLRPRRWALEDLVDIDLRRYLLRPTAMELFFVNRKNYMINFRGPEENRLAFEYIIQQKPPRLTGLPSLGHSSLHRKTLVPEKLVQFRKAEWTDKWVNWEMSTFEYLMHLNTAAGRTYNDLTQYPVFPWVLTDYTSSTLDLNNPAVYRDLSKPVGALDGSRLKRLQERRQAHASFESEPTFLYGSHYSSPGTVLYYMLRVEPFSSHAKEFQGGNLDHADRLFHCVAETWSNCLTSDTDVKELIPEWYYFSDMFENRNNLDLGVRQNGVKLHDVVLPPWAEGSAERFVRTNRDALESEYVSEHIHEWIDLIFGDKQRGPEAEKANNVFHPCSYEDAVDLSNEQDPVILASLKSMIAYFGQTPSQLFKRPHPRRQPRPRPKCAQKRVILRAEVHTAASWPMAKAPTAIFLSPPPKKVASRAKAAQLAIVSNKIRQQLSDLEASTSLTQSPMSPMGEPPSLIRSSSCPSPVGVSIDRLGGPDIALPQAGVNTPTSGGMGLSHQPNLLTNAANALVNIVEGSGGSPAQEMRNRGLMTTFSNKVKETTDSLTTQAYMETMQVLFASQGRLEAAEVTISQTLRVELRPPITMRSPRPDYDTTHILRSHHQRLTDAFLRSSTCLALANGAAIACCGYPDNAVKLHSTIDGQFLQSVRPHSGSGAIMCISMDREQRFLAAGAQDGSIIIWKLDEPAKAEETVRSAVDHRQDEHPSDPRSPSAVEPQVDIFEENERSTNDLNGRKSSSSTGSSSPTGSEGIDHNNLDTQSASVTLFSRIMSAFTQKKREHEPILDDRAGPAHWIVGFHDAPISSVALDGDLDIIVSTAVSSRAVMVHTLSDGLFLRTIDLPITAVGCVVLSQLCVSRLGKIVVQVLDCDSGASWLQILHVNGKCLERALLSEPVLDLRLMSSGRHCVAVHSRQVRIFDIEDLTSDLLVFDLGETESAQIAGAALSTDELSVGIVLSDGRSSWHCIGDNFRQCCHAI